MIFEKTATTLSLHATRKLTRYRATTIVLLFLSLFVSICVVIYKISLSMLIYPLATLLYSTTGRTPATYIGPPPNDPYGNTKAVGPTLNLTDLLLRRQNVNYAAIPMRRPEADMLLSYLNPSDIYLEYGASATTLAVPFLVRTAYSIEHDTHVCSGISAEMLSHKIPSSKLRAFCAAVPRGRANWAINSPFEEGSYRAFHNYVDFPQNNLSSIIFDRVLINGHARVACALRILPQLRESSLVFFHDYFLRPKHYSAILPYYNEVARVVATGPVVGYSDEPMGMLVLQPKPEYLGKKMVITATRLNTLYDEYVEKEPCGDTSGAEVAFKNGLFNSSQGGFDYYEMSRQIARETTRLRLLLDVIAFSVVLLTYAVIRDIYRKIFREALVAATSRTRFSTLLASDSDDQQGGALPSSQQVQTTSSKAE